eukprot:scaffold8.g1685.t1
MDLGAAPAVPGVQQGMAQQRGCEVRSVLLAGLRWHAKHQLIFVLRAACEAIVPRGLAAAVLSAFAAEAVLAHTEERRAAEEGNRDVPAGKVLLSLPRHPVVQLMRAAPGLLVAPLLLCRQATVPFTGLLDACIGDRWRRVALELTEAGLAEAARIGSPVQLKPGLDFVPSGLGDIQSASSLPGGHVLLAGDFALISIIFGGMDFVVAHEVAHALARHSLEGRCLRVLLPCYSLAVQGAVGVLLGHPQGSEGTRIWWRCICKGGLAAVLEAASLLFMRAQSRRHKYEADCLAIHLLQAAGRRRPLDSAAAIFRLFTELEAANGSARVQDSWLATHPASPNRLRRLQEQFG